MDRHGARQRLRGHKQARQAQGSRAAREAAVGTALSSFGQCAYPRDVRQAVLHSKAGELVVMRVPPPPSDPPRACQSASASTELAEEDFSDLISCIISAIAEYRITNSRSTERRV
jgi:hypothetical protein